MNCILAKLLPKVNFVETISKEYENFAWYTTELTLQSLWIRFSTLKRLFAWTRWKQQYSTFQNNYWLSTLDIKVDPNVSTVESWAMYVARNCRGRRAPPFTVTCFKCGNRGHMAHNCSQQQGNGQGVTPTQQAGGAPWPWWVLPQHNTFLHTFQVKLTIIKHNCY